jgi:putative ABC transport system permease protein
MSRLLLDIREAGRFLRANPGLVVPALLCIAIGVGGNTAAFSAVHGVLLAPLPYEGAERLVWIWGTWEGRDGEEPLSDPDLLDLRHRTRSFAEIGASSGDERAVLSAEGEGPASVRLRRIDGAYLRTLGAMPERGRIFRSEEERPGGVPVAILSHHLWKRRLSAAAEPVGTTVLLDGVAHEVIAVMPASFRDLVSRPDRLPDVWVPLQLDPAASRGMHRLLAIGRLATGVDAERAQQEMDALAARLAEAHPETNRGKRWRTKDLHEGMVAGARRGLVVLLAAVGLVLLIACANVGSLLLARAVARERETAVRSALGADHSDLLRRHLAESLLLGLAGGVLGLLLAAPAVAALSRFGRSALPLADRIGLDGSVLLFTLAVSLAAALVCGIIPWLQGLRADLFRGLRGGGGDRTRTRLSDTLVTAEVALALLVAVAAGLLTQSFLRLRAVDPGFRTKDVVVAHLQLSESDYPHPAQAAALYERLLARLRSALRVEAVTLAQSPPLSPYLSCFGFEVVGRPPFPPNEAPCADLRSVGPDYFEALEIPVLAGRPPRTARDGGPREVAINRLLQRQLFASTDVLGQRLRFSGEEYTVVGVVGDTRTASLSHLPINQVYRSLEFAGLGSAHLVIRAAGPPEGLFPILRTELHALDDHLAFTTLDAAEDLLDQSVSSHRSRGLLMGFFALAGVGLAVIGVFAVVSHSVSRRAREIGMRISLGAGRRSIFAMVVGSGMKPVLLGLSVGLLLSAPTERLLSSLLFEAGAYDASTILLAVLLLAGAGLAACWLPARRATRVEPAMILRLE